MKPWYAGDMLYMENTWPDQLFVELRNNYGGPFAAGSEFECIDDVGATVGFGIANSGWYPHDGITSHEAFLVSFATMDAWGVFNSLMLGTSNPSTYIRFEINKSERMRLRDDGLGVGAQENIINIGGYAKAFTLSAGTSGLAQPVIEMQGSNLHAGDGFMAMDFYNRNDRAASIQLFSDTPTEGASMHFFTKKAGGTILNNMTLAQDGRLTVQGTIESGLYGFRFPDGTNQNTAANGTGGTGGTGATGVSGVSGISGVSGVSGVSGILGGTGGTGLSGVSGISGILGGTGGTGIKGGTGGTGLTGGTGATGGSGTNGGTGGTGASGASGPSGGTGAAGGGGGLTYVTTTAAGAPGMVPTSTYEVCNNTATGHIYMAGDTKGTYSWGLICSYSLTAWTASNPTGLFQWYDASSGPAPTTNGTALTQWSDRSTSNNTLNVIEGTGGKYYTNIQNGLPAVYFDGGGDLAGANLADVAQPSTMFVVAKPTAWSTGGYQTIIDEYNGTQQVGKTTGNTNSYAYAGTSLQGDAMSSNNTFIVSAIFNGASSSIEVNNGSWIGGNAGTSTNANYPVIGSLGVIGGVAQPYTG
jgi:hypothetical protein